MTRQFNILVMVLCLLLAPRLSASDAFYAARIPVADRSEATLAQAASSALARVLVRVSGDESVVALPGIEEAILGARSRMALYSYEEVTTGMVLFAQFDGSVIKRLLREAGATFWGEKRPPVLLWLVVDEPEGRRFANVSADAGLLSELSNRLADRGVRLRLPLLDLQDRAALDPEVIWQKVIPRITSASERYRTPHLLIGRYIRLSSGRQLLDWMYVDEKSREDIELEGADGDMASLVAPVVDRAVDQMAAQYAVSLESESGVGQQVYATVTGVESYRDYRGVVAVFDGISILEGYRVVTVEGDRLELRVTGVGSADALARLIPQQSGLVTAHGDELTPDPGRLPLQWSRP